jgi:hypothetical protein
MAQAQKDLRHFYLPSVIRISNRKGQLSHLSATLYSNPNEQLTKKIINFRVLTGKTKRRKPEGLRQFQLYLPIIPHAELQMGHFPDFICRSKPTAYAKKGMLRVLTSFRSG